jgi:hypothetical protein
VCVESKEVETKKVESREDVETKDERTNVLFIFFSFSLSSYSLPQQQQQQPPTTTTTTATTTTTNNHNHNSYNHNCLVQLRTPMKPSHSSSVPPSSWKNLPIEQQQRLEIFFQPPEDLTVESLKNKWNDAFKMMQELFHIANSSTTSLPNYMTADPDIPYLVVLLKLKTKSGDLKFFEKCALAVFGILDDSKSSWSKMVFSRLL